MSLTVMNGVSAYFLEELLAATGLVIEEGSRCALKDGAYRPSANGNNGSVSRAEALCLSLARVDETVINYDLIEAVIEVRAELK